MQTVPSFFVHLRIADIFVWIPRRKFFVMTHSDSGKSKHVMWVDWRKVLPRRQNGWSERQIPMSAKNSSEKGFKEINRITFFFFSLLVPATSDSGKMGTHRVDRLRKRYPISNRQNGWRWSPSASGYMCSFFFAGAEVARFPVLRKLTCHLAVPATMCISIVENDLEKTIFHFFEKQGRAQCLRLKSSL